MGRLAKAHGPVGKPCFGQQPFARRADLALAQGGQHASLLFYGSCSEFDLRLTLRQS